MLAAAVPDRRYDVLEQMTTDATKRSWVAEREVAYLREVSSALLQRLDQVAAYLRFLNPGEFVVGERVCWLIDDQMKISTTRVALTPTRSCAPTLPRPSAGPTRIRRHRG